jgi:hypothetical protein
VVRLQRGTDGELAGDFAKPTRFTLDANAGWVRLLNVEGPPAVEPLRDVVEAENELRFMVRDSAESDDVTKYIMQRAADGSVTLGLAEVPGAPLFALQHSSSATSVADDWDASLIYGRPPSFPDNARLANLFRLDQQARQGGGPLAAGIEEADAERRAAARRMLDDGAVRSAADYYHAAFIFQHGNNPDDYLLAHALATAAVARGRQDAIWIATATLDRFLQSTGRSQIYGTQYALPSNGEATQGDYNRDLLPDTVRQDSGVPSLAEQARQLDAFNRRE